MKKIAMVAVSIVILAGCGSTGETLDSRQPDQSMASENAAEHRNSATTVGEDPVDSGDGEQGEETKPNVEPTGGQRSNAADDDRPIVTVPSEFVTPQDEILATYDAYQEAFLVAMGPPRANPGYAPLYDLLVEPQATEARETLELIANERQIIVDPASSETSHTVRFVEGSNLEKVEGNTVSLVDCFVDATEVQVGGVVVAESNPVTFVLAVEMKVVDGGWKVASERVKRDYRGVNDCADYTDG